MGIDKKGHQHQHLQHQQQHQQHQHQYQHEQHQHQHQQHHHQQHQEQHQSSNRQLLLSSVDVRCQPTCIELLLYLRSFCSCRNSAWTYLYYLLIVQTHVAIHAQHHYEQSETIRRGGRRPMGVPSVGAARREVICVQPSSPQLTMGGRCRRCIQLLRSI